MPNGSLSSLFVVLQDGVWNAGVSPFGGDTEFSLLTAARVEEILYWLPLRRASSTQYRAPNVVSAVFLVRS